LTVGGLPLAPFLPVGVWNDFFSDFNTIRQSFITDLTEPFFREGGRGSSLEAFQPKINVRESDNEIEIQAEVPGVNKDDLKVEVKDDHLIIQGEKKFVRKEEPHEEAEGKEGEEQRRRRRARFRRIESGYGMFLRTFALPKDVDPSKVKANYENGVLTIVIPKVQKEERSQTVQIQ